MRGNCYVREASPLFDLPINTDGEQGPVKLPPCLDQSNNKGKGIKGIGLLSTLHGCFVGYYLCYNPEV